jgi:hypothetical protein
MNLTKTKTLSQLRTKAHWRARRERVEKEIADKKRVQAQLGYQAKRDLGRYITLQEKTLEWLQKMESSTD